MISKYITSIVQQRRKICSSLKPISYLSTFRFKHQLAEINNETSIYPPIVDMSPEGYARHLRQCWYDTIKAKATVEEKLYELTVQTHPDLQKFRLSSISPTYNGVFFHRYITRSLLIEGLPDKLNHMNVEKELADIRDVLNGVLLNYYCNPWENNASKQLSDHLNEKDAGSKLLNRLIAQCFKRLAFRNDYILESTIQENPRLCSYWWHGGFESKKQDEENLCFRFEDYPAFVIRIKKPLSPIVEFDDPLCATADVPKFHYNPKTCGFESDVSHLSSVPGFWPGDPNEFPLLLVMTSEKLKGLLGKIEKYDLKKIEDSVGLMASFGYLNAVACNQGFTPFHDITYPFVTQTVLTNGQDWTFFVYQLNTIALHADVDTKDRRNLCWTSGKLRLFDTIEDGKVKGINDKVYELLLKFLLNAPVLKEGLDLKPYLGTDTRTDDEALNTRFFSRRMFSQCVEGGDYKKEVVHWIKIYKEHPDAPPSPFIKLA